MNVVTTLQATQSSPPMPSTGKIKAGATPASASNKYQDHQQHTAFNKEIVINGRKT